MARFRKAVGKAFGCVPNDLQGKSYQIWDLGIIFQEVKGAGFRKRKGDEDIFLIDIYSGAPKCPHFLNVNNQCLVISTSGHCSVVGKKSDFFFTKYSSSFCNKK